MILRIQRCRWCKQFVGEFNGIAVCERCGLLSRGDFGTFLSPYMSRFVKLLIARPEFVSRAEAMDYIWGDDPSGGPEYGHRSLQANFCRPRNRRRLAGLGLTIVGRYGQGFELAILDEKEWRRGMERGVDGGMVGVAKGVGRVVRTLPRITGSAR